MRGVTFYFGPRRDKRTVWPPFKAFGQMVLGTWAAGDSVQRPIVAVMHDYYGASIEERKQMSENVIALCEMKYAEKEVNNV